MTAGPRLLGERRAYEIDRAHVETLLDENQGPYFYRGRVLWAEAVRDRLP